SHSMDSRRLHLRLGRFESQRQPARNVFPSVAYTAALRAIPLLQNDERRGCVRRFDSAPAFQGHYFERIPLAAAQQHKRSLVQRRRRVSAVEFRLYRARYFGPALARESL